MIDIISYENTRELFGVDNKFELTEKQFNKFSIYCEMLKEWNEKINLTAITDDCEIAEKHFLDSILPLTMVDIPQNSTVIDVGTGAGFPSIPIKIMREDLNIILLDSLEKRLNFLRNLSDNLGYTNETVHSRAEDGARTVEHREKYDVSVSRAVANLQKLSEYCLPYVKVGGMFIALKGSTGRQEVDEAKNAIRLCGGEVSQIVDYTLPNGDGRTLVVITKINSTPDKYPRNSAQIKKSLL